MIPLFIEEKAPKCSVCGEMIDAPDIDWTGKCSDCLSANLNFEELEDRN